jgi:hypothetical protein
LDDPETPEELGWVVRAGVEALADIPWEDQDKK